MKQEFSDMPSTFRESWSGEFSSFSWHDFLTGIPSPLIVVTSYKENGKENACMQSWCTFVGDSGSFICILGSVARNGHLLNSLNYNKCCVINFPTKDIYKKCLLTVRNNKYEQDEISESGLTAEKAITVNAPRIKECFVNIECELLWEHEHFENSRDVVITLRAKHVAIETSKLDNETLGRYGEEGYIYNIHSPRNPITGKRKNDSLGYIQIGPEN